MFSLYSTLLRRKSSDITINPSVYNSQDYEILLTKVFSNNLNILNGIFSGPYQYSEDPYKTVSHQFEHYTRKLIITQEGARHPNLNGIIVNRVIFLSIFGGQLPTNIDFTSPIDIIPTHSQSSPIALFFILPILMNDTTILDKFPNSLHYPYFKSLHKVLLDIRGNQFFADPYMQEMVSQLDKWLSLQHSLENAISFMFTTNVSRRIKMFTLNNFRETSILTDICQINKLSKFNLDYYSNINVLPNKNIHCNFIAANIYVLNPCFLSTIKCKNNVKILLINMVLFQKNSYPINENFNFLDSKHINKQIRRLNNPELTWIYKYPLHSAVCEMNENKTKFLLDNGYSVNEYDDEFWTPLHYSSWYGNLEITKILIQSGQADINITNNDLSTPLHFACTNGHFSVVSYLLEFKHLIINAKTINNMTALNLCEKMERNDWRLISNMLKGYPINSPKIKTERVQKMPVKKNVSNSVISDSKRGSIANRNFLSTNIKIYSFIDEKGIFSTPINTSSTSEDVLFEFYQNININFPNLNFFALYAGFSHTLFQFCLLDRPIDILAKTSSKLNWFKNFDFDKNSLKFYIKRNVYLPLSTEKVFDSAVILNGFFNEAKYNVLNGNYPCNCSEALQLGALLYYLKNGSYEENINKNIDIGKLQSVIPNYVINNYPNYDLEVKLISLYKKITIGTDIQRSYLTICWKWPYYGSLFFLGSLLIKGKNVNIQVGVNTFGFHLLLKDKPKLLQSIPFPQVDWDCSYFNNEFILLRYDGSIRIYTKYSTLINYYANNLSSLYLSKFVKMNSPLSFVSQENNSIDKKDYLNWSEMFTKETENRRLILHGKNSPHHEDNSNILSKSIFQRFYVANTSSYNLDIFKICWEFGYEIDLEDLVVFNSNCRSQFSYPQFVSWWSQSKRSWLFLLNDSALQLRIKATKLFERYHGTNLQIDSSCIKDLLNDLMKSSFLKHSLIKDYLSELTDLLLVDNKNYLSLNEYIDWLSGKGALYDKFWGLNS